MNKYHLKKLPIIQLFLTILITLSLIQVVNANYSYEDNIYVSNVLSDGEGTPLRLGVVILNQNQSQEFDLEFSYVFNGEELNNKCTHGVIFEDELRYQKKVYCDIPTQETNGMYTAQIKIFNNSQSSAIYELNETFFYNSKNSYGVTSFEEIDRGTQITIDLNNENITEETTIYHDIPRQVLNNINPQNKDSLIESNKEFEIIEQNPIISWKVDSRDTSIEYVLLNKSVNNTYKNEFNTYPVEDRSITAVVLFSIVVLLIIIFLPLLKKRKNPLN